MKILIAKFRNIGDVLLITPLLENLKSYYPDCTIDIALNAGTQSMVSAHPHVRKLHIYDRKALKKGSLLKRMQGEVAYANAIRKEKYDLFIGLTEGERTAYIAWYSKALRRIGYLPKKSGFFKNVYHGLMPPQDERHTVEANLDALRRLEIPIRSKKVAIHWPEESEANLQPLPGAFVHIHPVSRWLFKCIADSTMAHVIDFVQQELQMPVVITAADEKHELSKVRDILTLCQSEPLNLAGHCSLHEVAAISARSTLFIGVDTAIMHMAAANGIPVLAFFGPSGAFHWGPWDNEMHESGYTKRNGFQRMGKHRVIQENRDCVPCGKDGCEGTKVSDCLMQLDETVIFETIREMIEKRESHAA